MSRMDRGQEQFRPVIDSNGLSKAKKRRHSELIKRCTKIWNILNTRGSSMCILAETYAVW